MPLRRSCCIANTTAITFRSSIRLLLTAMQQKRNHSYHQAARKPPPASHSADSLTSGMQRLSVSDRRGLATLSKPVIAAAAAAPAGAIATPSAARRRISGGIGSGNGSAKTPSSTSTLVKPGQVNGLADVANLLNSGRVCHVVVMAGAGISTASGIPDFRTPGTGLYDNLQQFKVPYPEAIFDLDYFFANPKPFFALAKELYPSGKYRPNLVHCFCRLLHDKGLLTRIYTQNIDGLERQAGLPPDKLVEAHGTFATATCTHCCRQLPAVHVRPHILRGEVPVCSKLRGRGNCPGVLKPDIVFFGEDLPSRFYHYLRDFAHCDLLIVLGTSLQVEPFAGIVDSTRLTVPRLLINRDPVGPFRGAKRRRPNDVVAAGDLVDRVTELARLAGWSDELAALAERIQLDIDASPDPFEPRGSPTGAEPGNSDNTNNSSSSSICNGTPKSTNKLITRQQQQQQQRPVRTSVPVPSGSNGAALKRLPPVATTSVANSRRSASTVMEAQAAGLAAAAARVKPGVPLFYRHRRSQSQQRRGRLNNNSSTSTSEDDNEVESSASSSDESSSSSSR